MKTAVHISFCAIWILLTGLTVVRGLSTAEVPKEQEQKEASQTKVQPPPTRIKVVTDEMHGVEIPDPYRWLEDQDSTETRAWIEKQNAYTRLHLDAIPGREAIRQQLEELSRVEEQTAPQVRDGKYFYMSRREGQEQPGIAVRDGVGGSERILVDPMELDSEGTTSLRIMDISPDGKVLAFAKRKGGADEFELNFLEVQTGQMLPDSLPPGVYYDVFLLPDRSSFIYTRRRSGGTRILEHKFGTAVEKDRVIFGVGIPDDKLIWLRASEDRRFIAAFLNEGAGNNAETDVYVLDRSEKSEFTPLVTGIPANFQGRFGGHTLFLQTSWKAPNGRILAVDLENPAREDWIEAVPHSEDAVIRQLRAAGGRVLVAFLRNVQTRLAVFEPDGTFIRDISLPTIGSGYFTGGQSWRSNEVFYGFSSFAHPPTSYRYDLETEEQSVWHKQDVPINSSQIETSQVWFTSKDGTRVPMFVVVRKGVQLDGNRPTLLYGYGGYGAMVTPFFWSVPAMWVQQGGVFAVANIRGGGEFGKEWHRAGMLENKQNSFDDFIAAAEWLIEKQYTRPEKLAILGGSNGGLLVGAVATQRPDLFKAVICQAPHLDMLRYHKFLKAAPWVHEYGNPEVKEEFEYLRRYSPYHQVRDGTDYPAMLFMAGDQDTRVAPLHARKMTARMQSATGSGLPVLLRYDLVGGHSGSGGLSRRLDQEVDLLVFLFWQLGIAEQ